MKKTSDRWQVIAEGLKKVYTENPAEGPVSDCGLLLLAGGKASRLSGREKGLIRLPDGSTIAGRILDELDMFTEKMISVPEDGLPSDASFIYGYGVKPVTDMRRFAGKGPLAGIFSALSCARSEGLYTVAWDMPFISSALALAVLGAADGRHDTYIPVDSAGRPEPLCGLYMKSCLPVMEMYLESGHSSVRGFLEKAETKPVLPSEHGLGDRVFSNINTEEDINSILFIQ